MSRSAGLSRETLALLERERLIPDVPALSRARAIAGARKMLASGEATPSPLGRRTLRIRWTTAVLACVVSAALGAAAYRLGVRERNVELRALSLDTQVAVPAASSSAVSGPPTRLRPKSMPRVDWRKRARR